ncbi:MAG: hypothetical protein QXW00_02220 [Candidatus Woesearchaeota archaeon]
MVEEEHKEECKSEDEEIENLALALRRTIPGYTVDESRRIAAQIIERQKKSPTHTSQIEENPEDIARKAETPEYNIAESTITLRKLMDVLIKNEEQKLAEQNSKNNQQSENTQNQQEENSQDKKEKA